MWPQGSRHRRWPPEPSNRAYQWRCSSDRSSYPAVPTLQSQLKHKKYGTISRLKTTTISASLWSVFAVEWFMPVCFYDCVIVPQFCLEEACGCAGQTTVHVSMCHTQLDFGILREQNILSLNVSVNHMMGVKMGKTLEDKYTDINTQIHTQSDDHNQDKYDKRCFKRVEALCVLFWRNTKQRVGFISSLLPDFSLQGKILNSLALGSRVT